MNECDNSKICTYKQQLHIAYVSSSKTIGNYCIDQNNGLTRTTLVFQLSYIQFNVKNTSIDNQTPSFMAAYNNVTFT